MLQFTRMTEARSPPLPSKHPPGPPSAPTLALPERADPHAAQGFIETTGGGDWRGTKFVVKKLVKKGPIFKPVFKDFDQMEGEQKPWGERDNLRSAPPRPKGT